MIHICILTMLSYAQSLVIPLAVFPLPFPLANSSLSSNPSYLHGIPPFVWCDPVHPGLRLLVNWPPPPHPLPILSPFPPHSIPSPISQSPLGFPQINSAPTKTTSRSRLYIVRNNNMRTELFWTLLYTFKVFLGFQRESEREIGKDVLALNTAFDDILITFRRHSNNALTIYWEQSEDLRGCKTVLQYTDNFLTKL
jgi:hypothetical protein